MLSIMYFEVITYFMYLNVGELYILFCVSSNHFFGLLYWNSKLNCSRNRPSDFYCHPSWQGIGRKRTSRPQEDVANGILVDSFLLLVSVSKLEKTILYCIFWVVQEFYILLSFRSPASELNSSCFSRCSFHSRKSCRSRLANVSRLFCKIKKSWQLLTLTILLPEQNSYTFADGFFSATTSTLASSGWPSSSRNFACKVNFLALNQMVSFFVIF